MEMRRRLRLPGGAGGEAEQRHVVPAGGDRLEADGFAQSAAVELGIVVGGAVEAHDGLQERALLGAQYQFVL